MSLRHLLLCLAFVIAQPLLAAETPAGPEKWEKEIAAFEAADRVKAPPTGGILFIGSSSIRLWKTLAEDFPGLPGAQSRLRRLADRGRSRISCGPHRAAVSPAADRVYSGGNDLNAGKSPEQVVADFKAFVAKVRSHLPEVRNRLHLDRGKSGTLGAGGKSKGREHSPRGVAERGAARSVYRRLFTHMMGPDGMPKPEIFVADQLHMNAAGYAIWKEVVGPFLAKE